MSDPAPKNGHNGQPINWISSYITQEWLDKAKIYRVDHVEGAELVLPTGRNPKSGQHFEGIAIPYFWPGDTHPREYRLRRDIPDYEQKADGSKKERNKYMSPPGRGNMVYIPPGTDPHWITDASISCFIVEGEKKSIALARYFQECDEKVLVIALPGVWNFRGKVGIAIGPQGERVPIKGMISDFERIIWRARSVRILFDTNAITDQLVNAARRELAKELIRRGALVRLLDLPPEPGINGVDDWLGKHGPAKFGEFLAEAEEGKNLSGVAAYPLTDTGNAERFITRHGRNAHWDTTTEKWLTWDGARWGQDRHLTIEEWAKDTVRAIPYVEGPVSEEDGEDLRSYSRKCESNEKLNSMLRRARAEKGIAVTAEDFNSDPNLMNFTNGTLDLKTGDLNPHRREDLISKIVPVDYDPDATCPRWERFLLEIFASNGPLIDFIWQSVGYSLVYGNPEKFLFICFGSPDTGKSTFINVLGRLFGEYAHPADINTFMGRTNPMVYNDLADMFGARLVTASESKETDRLNDSLIKMATGNDHVTGCRKYENPIRYIPGFKIWLSVNHKPIVHDSSGAMWNRVKPIPFEVKFWSQSDADAPPEGPFKDLELEKALIEELPGIAAWAVRGCHDWIDGGFRIPETVRLEIKNYAKESDSVGQFLDECCLVGDGYQVRFSGLFPVYEAWAKRRSLRVNSTTFARQLTSKGIKAKHTHEGNFRLGVGLAEFSPVKDVKDGEGSKNASFTGLNYYDSDDYERE